MQQHDAAVPHLLPHHLARHLCGRRDALRTDGDGLQPRGLPVQGYWPAVALLAVQPEQQCLRKELEALLRQVLSVAELC